MKRLVAIAIFFVIGLILADRFVTQKIAAQTQKPGMCYAQCGAYKFYWKGDFCFDMVQQNCTASFNAKDVISLLKSIRDSFLTGKLEEIVDVKPIFAAWLICKPLIEDCVAPQLSACETMCTQYPTFYAPNLTVGSDWGGSIRGLYYDETTKQLSMRVLNDGLGYASDILVKLTVSQTEGYDDTAMVTSTNTPYTIPELLFLGSRQNAPPGVTDIVTDFLIDQSRFHSWLSRFKSNADNIYIPPGWDQTISIDAPAGKLTRFTLTVDPNNTIVESNEGDNTYTLDIDKRPIRPTFEISNVVLNRQDPSLTNYQTTITITNTGDLSGPAALTVGDGWSDTKQIDGHGTTTFTVPITVDASQGSPNCSKTKRVVATVTDGQGRKQTRTIDVPVWAGYISGRVTDTKGKAVAGATITASTGQSTTSSDSGFYHIVGIGSLGKVTLTFSHPDYTDTITKEVEITFNKTNTIGGGCNVEGLSQRADVQLRDKPLILHVRLQSTPGPLVNGKVIFTGGAGSFTFDVPGQKDISEMEPGQFRVSAMAPGYVTKEIQVVLTPPEQTIDIVLEPLWGRPNDTGLSIITPVKLWEKTIAKGKIDTLVGSKNGKLVVVNTNDTTNRAGGPKSWTGTLTFINPADGTIIKSVTVPFNVGQSQVDIASSYDGRSVGFTYSIPDPVEKTSSSTFVQLFNAKGDALGTKELGKSLAVMSEVSPDGFFFYPFRLMNSSLYTYTRQEIQGKGGGDPMSYSASNGLHFLRSGNLVAGCKDGQCIVNLAGEEIRGLGNIHDGRLIDSSFDDGTIIIRGIDKLYYVATNSWNKAVESDPGFYSATVSPGGEYVIVAKGGSGSNSLSVFNRSGTDVTPKFAYDDVRYVEANDRGLFFSSVRSNTLTYYQIGKYASDYTHPETQTTGETTFGGLEMYVNTTNTFESVSYLLSWDRMYPFIMYRAPQKITIATSWGTLSLGAGTIFGKDGSGNPILLWGQADVYASVPITMTVVKNKLSDAAGLLSKMEKLSLGTLPEKDFVRIENLHTTYAVSSGAKGVAVTVTNGNVIVSSAGTKKDVHAGQVAEANDAGAIAVHTNWVKYIGWILLVAAIILVAGFVIVKFRK